MILVNTDYISGKELETLGLVQGSTIQSKNIGRDITQSFKTLVGGELKAYTDMMNEARALATKRMVGEAEALGADGVVNIRYASSTVMPRFKSTYSIVMRGHRLRHRCEVQMRFPMKRPSPGTSVPGDGLFTAAESGSPGPKSIGAGD